VNNKLCCKEKAQHCRAFSCEGNRGSNCPWYLYGFAKRPWFGYRVAMNFKEIGMSTIAPTLIQKLQQLPQQRLAEVEDFVEFLAVCESRSTAGAHLAESLIKLDQLNLPALSDAEIDAEIQAARKERAIQRS
jgi:hypothetical protein